MHEELEEYELAMQLEYEDLQKYGKDLTKPLGEEICQDK